MGVVVAILVASCTTAPPPPPGTVKSTPAGLHASISNATIKPGGTFDVKVRLDNHGQPPYSLNFGTECHFTWTFTDAQGQTATTRCMICKQAPSIITLSNSFYETSFTVPTQRLCELPWPYPDDSLPVGKYTITVQVIGYEGQFATEPVAFEVIN
jgi:hypothetical protein